MELEEPVAAPRTLASPEVAAELEGLGTADLVVGLPTAGAMPTAAGVARAARDSVEERLAGLGAVFVHVDAAPVEETLASMAAALGPHRVFQVAASGLPSGKPTGAAPESDDAVRVVLEVGRRLGARAIAVLDPAQANPAPDELALLVEPILKDEHGLVLPCFDRGRHEGTLTHALVVPLVRALFGRRLAYPFAREFACSSGAAAALLGQDVWGTELARQGLEFWIPAAILAEGLAVSQVLLGPRSARAGRPEPLGPTVGRVASCLFALAERYEAAWLELRGSEPVPIVGRAPEMREATTAPDPERMLAGFRLGVRDLLTVWERILAPENLAEILDLSDAGVEEFRLSDRLWTRVVYDFLLGYRVRVVYRTHLVQSLAPLYLGRAASVLIETRGHPPVAVAESLERLSRQFENEKRYLVERWP